MKNNGKWRERIFCDLKMMGGEPVIKGTRVTVAVVVGSMADGMSVKEILRAFPKIKEEDIKACLRYAADSAKGDMQYSIAV